MFKLELDCKVPSWNTLYAGQHWTKRKQMADEIHELVYYSAIHKKKNFIIPVIADIEVHYKGKRRHDPDNACVKMFIDGLVQAKILQDDDSKNIKEVRIRVKTGMEKDKIIIKLI